MAKPFTGSLIVLTLHSLQALSFQVQHMNTDSFIVKPDSRSILTFHYWPLFIPVRFDLSAGCQAPIIRMLDVHKESVQANFDFSIWLARTESWFWSLIPSISMQYSLLQVHSFHHRSDRYSICTPKYKLKDLSDLNSSYQDHQIQQIRTT